MLLKRTNLNVDFISSFLVLFIVIAAPLFLAGDLVFALQTVVIVGLAYYGVKNRRKLDMFDGFVLLFALYAILITFARGILSAGIIYSLLILAVLVIYIKLQLQRSNHFLRSIYLLHAGILVANFVTMFFPSVGPTGAPQYLLGGKNALAIFLVPTMFYIAYYSRVAHQRYTRLNILLLGLAVLTLFMGGSSTGIVIGILTALAFLFIHKLRLSHYVYLAAFVVIQAIVFSTQKLYEVPFIADFITNYLGKDLTFTGRTTVWEVAMNAISHTFFGYGKGNGVIAASIPNLSEAHNMVLELLLTGGFVLLALFAVIVLGAFGFRKKKSNADLYRLSAFFVFMYFILGLTESVPFKVELWIMFAIIISTNHVIANENKRLDHEK